MKTRESIGVALRFYILRRDNYTCQYCGARAPDAALHVEHRTPVAEGGTNDPENLCAACVRCNLGKGVGPARHTPTDKSEVKLWLEERRAWWREWAMLTPCGSAEGKVVLLVLANHADAGGDFGVPLSELVLYSGAQPSDALAAIHGFEALGMLSPGELSSIVQRDGDGEVRIAGQVFPKRPDRLYRLSDWQAPLCFSSAERVHG